MLINLSNHPYKNWSEIQKSASAIYGKCIDLSFPRVKATDNEDAIRQLGLIYCSKIMQLSSKSEETYVHIMGEMTFTYYLINLLNKKGVICVASTSERIVREISPGHKEVKFQFARFRRYIV